MVFGSRMFYPAQRGLRKFLNEGEEKVMKCLWSVKPEGCKAIDIREHLLNINEYNLSVKKISYILQSLANRGLIEEKTEKRSKTTVSYHPKYSERELIPFLVDQIINHLFLELPEETRKAAIDLGLI